MGRPTRHQAVCRGSVVVKTHMCHAGALGASLTPSPAQTPSHPAAPASSSAAAQPGSLPGSAPKPKFKVKLGQGPPSAGESSTQPVRVGACCSSRFRLQAAGLEALDDWQQRNIGMRGMCMGNEKKKSAADLPLCGELLNCCRFAESHPGQGWQQR